MPLRKPEAPPALDPIDALKIGAEVTAQIPMPGSARIANAMASIGSKIYIGDHLAVRVELLCSRADLPDFDLEKLETIVIDDIVFEPISSNKRTHIGASYWVNIEYKATRCAS